MTAKSKSENSGVNAAVSCLDQLSTSQKTTPKNATLGISPELERDIESAIEQSKGIQAEHCPKNPPYIFFVDNTGKARIVEGCCNDWTCPRCGQIRARTEYGRIVNAARVLSEQEKKLYFHTITCRGRDMPLDEAEHGYLKWTNRLLSTCRARSKKQGDYWCYAQVTERQKRMHPHSHIITTFLPDDAYLRAVPKRGKDGKWVEREVMWSDWWNEKNVSAGLGNQCEITEIRNPVAVAVYVSKYLFKDAVNTEWPKGWRRIRYSQNWPKMPHSKPDLAFPLIKASDWYKMQDLGLRVHADSEKTLEAAYARLITCVTFGVIKENYDEIEISNEIDAVIGEMSGLNLSNG